MSTPKPTIDPVTTTLLNIYREKGTTEVPVTKSKSRKLTSVGFIGKKT